MKSSWNLLSSSSNENKGNSNMKTTHQKKSPDIKKSSSWLKIPNINFTKEVHNTSLTEKSPKRIQNTEKIVTKNNPNKNNSTMTEEHSSLVPDHVDTPSKVKPKPKFLSGVQNFASTIRTSTTAVADDLFGIHQNTSTTNPNEEYQPRDIFSASVSDVILDISKGAISLMKPSKTKKSTDLSSNNKVNNINNDNNNNKTTPTSSPSKKPQVLSSTSSPSSSLPPSLSLPQQKRSVSDFLEIDKDSYDSATKLSTYHVDKAKVLDDDDDGSALSFMLSPSSVSFVHKSPSKAMDTISKINLENILFDNNTTNAENQSNGNKSTKSFSSKVEFMQSLTDMPEELLEPPDTGNRFNSLPGEEGEKNEKNDDDDDGKDRYGYSYRTNSSDQSSVPQLSYDDDDVV